MKTLLTGLPDTQCSNPGNTGDVAWLQRSMADDIKQLIEQLRDPRRVYPLPGDDKAAESRSIPGNFYCRGRADKHN